MIYSIICMCVFSFAILLRNYKNKLTWIICCIIWGFVISLFSLILMVTKTGNYFQTNSLFYYFDKKLYVTLLSIGIPFSSILRLYNLGIALNILSMLLFTIYLHNKAIDMQSVKWKNKHVYIFLLPILYMIFYDPYVSYYFYIILNQQKSYSDGNYNNMLYVIEIIDVILYFLIIVVFVFLLYKLIILIKGSKVRFIRNQLLCLGLSILAFIGMYVVMFTFFPIRKPYMLYNTIYYLLVGNTLNISENVYLILSVTIVFSVILIFVLLSKYKGLIAISYFKKFFIRKKTKTVKISYRNIFHSFKNTLFAIRIMTEKGKMTGKVEEKQKVLDEISLYSGNAINSISKLLDSMMDVVVRPNTYSLIGCIEEALTQAKLEQRINVVRNYQVLDQNVFVDKKYLVDALINILNNASDAIFMSDKEQGYIHVDMILEMEWVIIKISDNGCGIKKSKLKKIFKPFFTTKGKSDNWGIGLHSAIKIITAHMGVINVVSQVNYGTTMEIMLPNMKGSTTYE